MLRNTLEARFNPKAFWLIEEKLRNSLTGFGVMRLKDDSFSSINLQPVADSNSLIVLEIISLKRAGSVSTLVLIKITTSPFWFDYFDVL